MNKKKSKTENPTEPEAENFPEPEEVMMGPEEEKSPDRDLADGITLEDYPLGAEDVHLQELLAEKEQQLAEEKNRYLRLFADFDNYKKRILKEKNEIFESGNESLLKELLPVLDNFERALESVRKQRAEGGDDISGVIDGLELILNQWQSCLGRYGVKPIQAVGKPFDPNLHDAIGQAECEEENAGKVISEAERGYLLKNRLLRPARVVVGKPAEARKDIEVEVGEQNPEGDNSHGDE